MKTRGQCKEYFEVTPLHCNTNTLIRFAINNSKSQNIPDTSDFPLDISWVITVESSPLHIASIAAVPEPGTSGLRAQVVNHQATHPSNGSFKDNICSMLCAVVWFHGVHLQEQPLEVFLKKVVLKNSAKFTGK